MLSRSAIRLRYATTRVSTLSTTTARTLSTATTSSSTATSNPERQFKYFDNLEVKDGVAIVRFNGPEKMNTISAKQRDESGENCFYCYFD